MNISICITTLNEEDSVERLLDSLLMQSKKPDQIIIVDGGSQDKTVEIIRHYQKKDGRIKLLVEKCSRARGRNLGVEIAIGEIVLMTDAGCVASPDWVKNIVSPFENAGVDVVAGFYKMVSNNFFQKAESVFLGTRPNDFDVNFLPSTRSIAFTKQIWEKVGGFPESVKGAAEDTIFNYKLLKAGARISRMKNAVVGWGMPGSIKDFRSKIYEYAKGDAKSKIWIFPGKGFTSHNIKVLFVAFRYLAGFSLLVFTFKFHFLLPYLFICVFAYLIFAFRKIYLEFRDWRVAVWGPFLQIVSDLGVTGGFVSGILNR
ncbi:MAG: glycosyltransferase [Candidatus Woesebacteria bacterium]|nr:MAG: glycosyltransferase [Candidatus Woesebacteria bacterium]